MTYDAEAETLVILAAYSQSGHSESNSGWQVPVDKAWEPVLASLRRGESYVVADLQAMTPFSSLIDHLQDQGVRAEIWEPLMIAGSFAGMLGVGLESPGIPSSESQEIVRELALQLSIGLAHARLYEEIQRYANELEHLVHQRTAALEATEARFRAIFEEAAIGIALVDGEAETLLAANPALQTMLGYSETQLIGMAAADLLADVGEEADQAWSEVVARAADTYQLETNYRRSDGSLGEANIVLSLLRQREAEAAPLVLALVEDITERKNAQQALIRAERLAIMGRMAASMAHEVNNPLQSVLGCLGLAVEAMEDGADASTYMDVAMDELARAARIVHQMRDLGRRQEARSERVDIVKLVQKVMLLTEKQAQNQQVTMESEEGEDLPPVLVVRDQIEQVFLNLVLNGIEAMPEGGTLTIRVTRTASPSGVTIAFTDTGVGIAPDKVATMFEAFQSTKELGLGMGLYVSRNIVQEHGGRIDVKSVLGEGSTFTVWLPA